MSTGVCERARALDREHQHIPHAITHPRTRLLERPFLVRLPTVRSVVGYANFSGVIKMLNEKSRRFRCVPANRGKECGKDVRRTMT